MHYVQPNPHQNLSSSHTNGENDLLTAAMPLLGILSIIKQSHMKEDIQTIHTFLVKCLHAFEQDTHRSGFSTRQILATKYCLCTALDEAILCTQWGKENGWSEISLLSTFYKETFGGERFYIILETMLEEPAVNVPLLEILYILLKLGFKGKHHNKDPLILSAIQHDLIQKITPYRHPHTYYFLDRYENARPKKITIISLWLIIISFFVLMLVTSIIFNYQVEHITQPIFDTIDAINKTLNIDI